MAYVNTLYKVITGAEPQNSLGEMTVRACGFHIDKQVNVTGTGSVVANILQVTGTVVVTNQWAEINGITTLVNLTNMYASLYDGTNSIDLTADGAVLSGSTVGSFFTKNKVSTEIYSVNNASECRMLEELTDKKSGRPFTITQKNGADTFIRLHYTTTDSPVDFDVKIHFEYYPVNGGSLTFL